MKTTVLIGDSIRMGYKEKVCELLAGRATIWTPQENGRTSENVLAHLDEWIISRQPDIVHINCGLHDLATQFDAEAPAIPLHAYEQNVRSILTQLQAETKAIVIWALTTPVNQEWHHKNKTFDRFEKDVTSYNAAAAEICRKLGIPINDLYSVVISAGAENILLNDGVHFKPEGCDLLGEHVAECIERIAGLA